MGLSVEAAHYYARIYGVARSGCLCELRRAGCREEEAEEIFSATFERIMARRDPEREGFSSAQTVALLKHACHQRLVDERRHREVLRFVPLSDASARSDPSAQSPAEAAEEREAVAIAREAVASLPGRDRAIFLQRHHLGLSPEEIVRGHPGLTRRTYRKLMQRANARALAAFAEIEGGARCAEIGGELLRRYLAEEASEGEERIIRAHLNRCPACRRKAARVQEHLHEVALGLLALGAHGRPHAVSLLELPARLLELAEQGGRGLLAAAKGVREALRGLAIRAATALPGSGGESAAGQLAGASGAKAISACAAGALTVGCLAAGVVPGVGGLELAGHPQGHPGQREHGSLAAPKSSRSPASSTEPQTAGAASVSPAPADGERSRRPLLTKRPRPAIGGAGASEASSAEVSRGADGGFGAEATGTGVPAPSFSAGEGSGASSGEGTVSSSHSAAGGSGGGEVDAGPEFGF